MMSFLSRIVFFNKEFMLPRIDKSSELYKYIRIIQSRWKIIALFFVTVVLATLTFSLLQTNIYRGTVTLLIDKDTAQILEIKDVVALGSDSYLDYIDYFYTQKEIITSRSILKQVFDKLNLKEREEFQDESDPLRKLRKKISVEDVSETRLLQIHAHDKDPKFSALLANTLAEIYTQQNITKKMIMSQDIGKWLSGEITILKQKVQNADLVLQKFKEKHNIVSLEDKQNIILEKLHNK
ncbi:GumC family protein [Candidatus Auribacterota bacterium]